MGNEIGKKNKVDVLLLKKSIFKKKNYRIKYFPKLLINFVYLLNTIYILTYASYIIFI